MKRKDDPFRDIERLFDQLSEFGPETRGDIAVDIVDEDDQLVVVADLPGYDADDIEVQLHDERRLQIAAERSEEYEHEEGQVVRRERRAERASRSVTLPEPVAPDDTQASYENGVLSVRLAKQTHSDEGTDIPVN
jgi:HSP20 family protein